MKTISECLNYIQHEPFAQNDYFLIRFAPNRPTKQRFESYSSLWKTFSKIPYNESLIISNEEKEVMIRLPHLVAIFKKEQGKFRLDRFKERKKSSDLFELLDWSFPEIKTKVA